MTRKEGHTGIINIRLKEKKKKKGGEKKKGGGRRRKEIALQGCCCSYTNLPGECGHRRATRAATSLLGEQAGGTGAWGPPKSPEGVQAAGGGSGKGSPRPRAGGGKDELRRLREEQGDLGGSSPSRFPAPKQISPSWSGFKCSSLDN